MAEISLDKMRKIWIIKLYASILGQNHQELEMQVQVL